ncbi:type I-G CRISPR-associated RAMP protein Csb1/Cas7g [Alicyclobacillus acidiphilus]|uniref:type I-G CRISPR-associated RAMP protein Csb1/Cas7g n=1 Tax=Alicyclobacillus acidiphilus TaxID=182455 RepID=UPI000B2DFE0D|nr:type I-U CRISPR-associated RAMP protein Csb1/Cas7u [Alicyclobacillus acidiphilus]
MISFSQLEKMVRGDAALRRRQVLQPIGGPGDKIFPPTYPADRRDAPPQHVYEVRKIDGTEIWCVLLDSVQSQANRMEEALLTAVREEGIRIPHLIVDFKDHGIFGLSEITSLDAPHRVYDAIMRDSLVDGKPFMQSEIGIRLAQAKPDDASALLELSPTALLFGAWHSTGGGGGLGARFARCLVSEIMAIDVPVELGSARGQQNDTRQGANALPLRRDIDSEVRTAGRRTGSRMDPLGIQRKVEVFKTDDGSWDVSKDGAGKGAKQVRPSEINHGNIAPTVAPLGITCDHAEHTFVLSFAAMRRLRFGSRDRDAFGRTLIAALGLLALAEQDLRGYSLRSRCDLVPHGLAPLEVVHPDGTADIVEVDLDSARHVYEEAFEAAQKAGFNLATDPVRLAPQDKLVYLVKESQRLALSGKGGEAEDEK